MTAAKNAPKLRKYEYSNNFQDGVSFKGQVFIYVLMTNVEEGLPARPFYVGQTDNLHARFSSHEQINWHFRMFGRPVKIWVAGKVNSKQVLAAEQDLIASLVKNGYWLSNIQSENLDEQDLRVQDIRQKNFHEIKQYVLVHKGSESVVAAWAPRWVVTADGTVKAPRLKTTQTIRRQQRRRIVAQDVVEYVQRQDGAAMAVLVKLARTYAPRTKTVAEYLSADEIALLQTLDEQGYLRQFFIPQGQLKLQAQRKNVFDISPVLISNLFEQFAKLKVPDQKTGGDVLANQIEHAEATAQRRRLTEKERQKPISQAELRKYLKLNALSLETVSLNKLIIDNFDEEKQLAHVFVAREEQEDLQLLGTYQELKKFWKTTIRPRTGIRLTFYLTVYGRDLIVGRRGDDTNTSK